MTRVSPAAFRTLLDDLDDEELAAFVAAVYDARGWETERVDGGVVTTPPGERDSRRLAVPSSAADGDGSRVAGSDAAADEVVDADDLRELVSYALDADARTRLFRRFFDRDPPDGAVSGASTRADEPGESTGGQTAAREEAAGPARDGTSDAVHGATTGSTAPPAAATAQTDGWREDGSTATRPTGDDDGSAVRPRWLLVALAIALVGVVVAAGPALTSPTAGPTDAVGSTGDAAGSTGDAATNGTATTADGTGTAGATTTDEDSEPLPAALERMHAPPVEGPFPPGVDDRSITDASRLADAHEAALTGQSFTVRIAYLEFVDEELRGVAHERVAVAGPGRYHARVDTLGTLGHESTAVGPGPAYADGTTRYVRPLTGPRAGTVRTEPAERDRFVDRTERYVRWYLSVDESRIVGADERDGTTFIRIALAGDPWPGTANLTGWALVDRQGLVRVIHREYTPTADPSVRIETTVRIDPGETTVTRPAWVDAAATNRTAGEETATPGA